MNFFNHLITRAFVARHSRVRVSPIMWRDLVAELGRRAGGVRESGAFLLAPSSGRSRRTVQHVVYFDDVDPDSLTGGITMHSSGFDELWAICSAHGMRVVADVHTHPSTNVHQSDIDQRNPMIATEGHVAIIVPHLASGPIAASNCGVHTYQGAYQWGAALGAASARLLYIGRWA